MVEIDVPQNRVNEDGSEIADQGKALQFALLQNNEIQITDEAMELLGTLPTHQKLAIVTIVGSINAGKSSLANKLVGANDRNGFGLREEDTQSPDNLKKSKTQGLQIWSKPITLKDGAQLLVLDMQGLPQPTPPGQGTASMRSPRTSALRSPRGLSAQRSNPTDRLLAFATLISSFIVYTQTGGSVHDAMIECLEPIAKFSDQVQKELGAELGAKASILSTSSIGNMSARSFGNSSVLDITSTVSSDLKDIVCQSLLCVLNDFSLTEAQVQEGVSQRKAANMALEKAFVSCCGVTNETIRKNKTMDCLKNMFPHRSILSVAAESQATKDMARIVSTIKRKATPKSVCGKAINGNMLLALSLEYAETLSQPSSSNAMSLPGAKNSTMHSLVLLFQCYGRVAEEETMRISDTVMAEFDRELEDQVNDQTMPLSEKIINKTFKKLESKYKGVLRQNLAEIATFDEVMFENDKIEERMKLQFDTKRSENYSQGYYFSLGLLKQLYGQNFLSQDTEPLTAQSFKEKWITITNDFKFASGDDSLAKWDVFAECFIRLPIEVQNRFVDYSRVENEQVIDLATETDTMDNEATVGGAALPQDLLRQQIQTMTFIEEQIETMKQEFQVRLTESQVKAQKVLQSHQELDQAKRDNEANMETLRRQRDELLQDKNEMDLKIQAVDRERGEIQGEFESISELKTSEQSKHRALINKNSGVEEDELAEYSRQTEELRQQLAQLDDQLMVEEQEMRSEVTTLETEIKSSREEMDEMEQALAQKDKSDCTEQVNQFFGHEVPEQYLGQIKEIFQSNAQDAKDLKLRLFEQQRTISDVDYQYSQEQLKLKQELDEKFKEVKKAKERELREVQTRYDEVRQRNLELTQKKESINYQLQAAMRTLEEKQLDQLSLTEAKEELENKINEDLSKIVAMKASLTEGGSGMETLEQQIYELSVKNRNQLEVKERLIELISEIVKTSQRGKPTPELMAIFQSLPDDRNKSRLEKLLFPKTAVSSVN